MAELRGDLSLDTSDAASGIEQLAPVFEDVVGGFASMLAEALGSLPIPEIDTSQIESALTEAGETGSEAIASSIASSAEEGAGSAADAVASSLTAGGEQGAEGIANAISGIEPEPVEIAVDADTSAAEESIDALGESASGATTEVAGLGGGLGG